VTRRVEIEAEGITLHGVAPASREAIAAAIEAELQRLLTGARSAGPPSTPELPAAAIGAVVARAVHARLPPDAVNGEPS
jgi:hypothetical protein